MHQDPEFHFSVRPIPEGEALTFAEIEERCLKRLHETNDKCVQSLITLSQLYSGPRHHEKACQCIEQLIELSDDPEQHGAYYLALGAHMEGIRDYREAAKFYLRALALEPCRNEVWYFIHNNLGYSLNQLGEYDASIPYLRRAIEIEPRLPNAYKNLGLAFEAKGNFAEAAELFITATQANASDSRSLGHLENLMSSHPELEVDLPDLGLRLAACRRAVKIARSHQPDLPAIWKRDRLEQKGR